MVIQDDLRVKNMQALSHDVSDHLPLSMEVELPENVQLVRDEHYQSILLDQTTRKSNIS